VVAFELKGSALFDCGGATPAADRTLAILEAAYCLDGDDTAWLGRIACAAQPLMARELGLVAYCYEWHASPPRLSVESAVFRDCPAGFDEALSDSARSALPEYVSALYSGMPCLSMGSIAKNLSQRSKSLAPYEPQRMLDARCGVADVRFVVAREVDGTGCALAVPMRRSERFPARLAGQFALVARHLAVARRLRRALKISSDQRRTLDVQAVLGERGAILHAEGAARDASRRVALSAAARALIDNRASFRKVDPDRAVRLWHALVEARWSLVEAVDVDGKRFWLARQNTPDLRHPAELTPDERHVAALTAFGHSSKLIAYELGLSPAIVSELTTRVLRKLRLRSRAELIRLFAPANERDAPPRAPSSG
jgi:DNA-binding CsgD family transcriptional regulator